MIIQVSDLCSDSITVLCATEVAEVPKLRHVMLVCSSLVRGETEPYYNVSIRLTSERQVRLTGFLLICYGFFTL